MKKIFFVIGLLILGLSAAFPATLTFGSSAPTPVGSAALSNWTGAAFDADNVGGSGVNADGGANNGASNDGTTYVATDRPAQGQTFTTGSNPGGYTITAITVRQQGYTNNIATGSNIGTYRLNNTGSTFRVRVGRISGTTFIPYTIEYATSGGTGNPGQGGTANGPGTYLTFTFKAPIVLQPNTVYAFDIGTTGDYFEILGIRDGASGGNPYVNGTAYTSGSSGLGGGTVTTQAGDRVFMIDMAPYTPPAPGTFVHPGLLSTEADFERMRTNVALGLQPWTTGYNALISNWMGNNPSWSPHAQSTITRSGTTNNSSILYNDIAVAYGSALRWKISGDTAYADEAVRILNAWAYTLTSIQGDTNAELCNLYGYQFACVAEVMRTYSGWAPADIAQFQTMIYNVFYGMANNFLTNHNGTAFDHYWANWDLCAMNAIYAIGVLNDNSTLTSQAITYFKSGIGNGCVDRTVNFIHPGFLGQGQEIGRDQGHASLDVSQLSSFCQMAWNQGIDLFGYENNRVLSLVEYTAKYNLGQDVPFVPYYSSTGGLMTAPGSGSRGATGRPGWATFYNHYVNIMGLAAPYTQTVYNQNGPNWSFNGDDAGWDYLTTALPPIATGANPSGLTALAIGQQPQLSWWGSAYATSYNVKRSTTSGGPYTTIATGLTTNTYIDTNPVAGVTNYYVVTGSLSGGGETGNSNEASAPLGNPIYAKLLFDETSGTTAADATGNGWNGTLVNGATWTTGQSGGAVNLAKASKQYVSLPSGVVANLSDFTISAWVYQNSATTQARIFDFGNGDGMYGGTDPWGNQIWLAERYMYLTSQGSAGKLRFGITRSCGSGEENVDGNAALPTNQWVHVIVTKNGSVVTLYVNGQAVGQSQSMPMVPMQILPTTQNYIGRSQWRNDPYFDGKIDDFRIYRGAMTTGQAYTLATGLSPATPPPAPTNLTVTAQPGGQNVLSWTASPGATNYTVLRSTSPTGPFTVIAGVVQGTTYTDTGLTAGTTYYYEVDGANTGGDGAVSSPSNGVVALPPIPSAPSGLNAIVSSSTVVSLSWTAGANASTYNVKRSLTSGGPYTTIASGVSATTFTDTGLATGTTYYYVVSGVNAAGEGPNSGEDSAMPTDLLVHLPFDETYGSTSADTSGNGWTATLVNSPAWTTGIFGNALNFSSASSQSATLGTGVLTGVNDFTISVWVKMTSFATWARIFDFGTGTTNYMFLSAQGPAGAGKPRFAIRTPSVSEQDIDSSVALPTGTWTQIVVTLSGTTGKMYINGTLVGTNSSMSLTPASLGSTTLNYFGRSQFSADPYLNGSIDDFRLNGHALTAAQVAASANPQPAIPTNLSANPSDGQITLSWAVSETATTYNVKRATTSGGPYTTVGSGLTSPYFVDTGLTDGTTYYYVVSAVNWLGESANSAETAATPYPIAWAAQDVGTVAAAGSSSVSGATVTVNGSGADIWGTADAFQFRSVPVTGNCIITARVWSVQNINSWSKAGVMIRGSLAANSMNATLLVTPTTVNGITWQYRTANGGSTSNTDFSGIMAPYWVRLVRTGTTIQGYRSVDGVNWVSSGTVTLSLGTTAYVGLAVTSHTDGTLCTATFDNVSVNWVPDAPTNVTATPGPRQVALSWDNVPNATSYNISVANVSGGPYVPLAAVTSSYYLQTGFTSSTTSYYVVTAVNIAGQSLASNETSAAPIFPPAAPSGLTAASGTSQIALSWTASSSTTNYNLYRSTSSGGPYTVIANPTGTNYADTSAVSGTTYYYVVSAVNTAGESGMSSEVNAMLLPGAVTGVSAAAGSNQVSLNWSAAAGAATYNIARSNTSGGPYSTIASGISATNYADTGLVNGTMYYYVISATNASGTGANSSEVSAKPMPPLPAAPTGLAATGKIQEIDLSWTASAYASSYNVKRSSSNGGPYTTIASGVTSTNYNNTGLSDGATYYYVVTAVNLSGESSNSTQASATTTLTTPGAVTGLVAVANSDQVTLTWNAVANATSYTISRANVSGGPYTVIASGVATTSYVNAGLTNGTTYYYVVAAVNNAGTGPNSVEVNGTPAAQNLFWDTTTAAGLGNGSGSWDAGITQTWSNTSAGASNPLLPWLNDDNAFFQTGGAFTATIGTGVTLKVGSINQLVAGTAATISGGTLQINTNAGITNAVGGGNSALTINSAVVLNSPNVVIDNETTSGGIYLTGIVSETGGSRAITKTGAGGLTLGEANTYSGGMTINAGSLIYDAGGNTGTTGTITPFGTGSITANGSKIRLGSNVGTNNFASFTIANAVTLNGGALYEDDGFQHLTGSLAIGANGGTLGSTYCGTSDALNGGFAKGLFIDGAVTGSGNLTIQQSGYDTSHGWDASIVYLTNSGAGTYSGTITVNPFGQNGSYLFLIGNNVLANATINLAGNNAGGRFGTSTLIFGSGTSANPASSAYAIGGLSGSGNFALANTLVAANSFSTGNAIALTVGGNGSSTTYTGVMSGAGSLAKIGAGTLTLSGANTYTGATTVNNGTLLVNGSLAAGSAVTVNTGATLGGSGMINGTCNLSSGGIIAPAGSGAGTITFAGSLNLSSGAVLNFDLGATSSSDSIVVTGSYVAPASGTATINANALTGFGPGTYTLITGATGISASSFTLGTTPPGGYNYQLNASGGTLSLIVSASPLAPTGLAATPFNSEVDLSWSASAGATSYNVLRSTTNGSGYSTIATGVTTPSYVDTGLTNGTTYYYVVTAVNGAGTSGNSNQASAVPVATPIIDSWYDTDIGNVAQGGSSSYSVGTFTLRGSGSGMAGTADGADYTYQPLVGDGTIIARVASCTAGESGVMIRESLASNARFVDMMLQLNVGAVFQSRTTVGGMVSNGAGLNSIPVPYWVKLSRVGNVFTGYISPDGVTWTQVGTITNTMASSVYVGLVQSSMTNGSLSTGTFTNVSIVPTSAWASQDIGAVSTVGASYYSNGVATINGSGAGIAGTADQFRYTYMPASGDCDITVRVATVSNTNANAKAGVMIRETLATNSKAAAVVVTPGSGVAFNYRSTTGGSISSTVSSKLVAPYWVRIVRSGNTFTAYRSANGTTWTSMKAVTISMATNVYIGMPVCATTSSTALCTATLDNITAHP